MIKQKELKNYNLGDLGLLNPEKIHNWYINFKWDISPYELVKIEENIKFDYRIWDIEKLHRQLTSGIVSEPITLDFNEISEIDFFKKNKDNKDQYGYSLSSLIYYTN